MMTQFVMMAMVLLLTSCQPKSEDHKANKRQTVTQIGIDIDDAIEGQYLAVFETLNPQLTSRITGAFTFSREKELDELVGDVRITNAGIKVIHAQNVRQGRRCPTMDDDQNYDGIIDALEGEAVYGPILFPLDGDLSTQSSHDGEFPIGDVYGNYIYSRVAKFSEFIADLRSEPTSEGYLKLKSKEALRIEGRAVVVHGIDQAADLPATVGSTGRASPYHALPIVCGIISKVLSPPGEVIE
jgi:hypothetical protein